MAKTLDLRTYLLLERAFARRLQRSWRIQSAPTYARITQACLDHKWDEARRLVPELDMAEVGTENREWITYMLLSCAVFGAGTVAKKKPSFVGVGTFDTFLKQTTTNILQYLEFSGTAQVQREALHLIAQDEAEATRKVAWEESQHPRDKEGRFILSTEARETLDFYGFPRSAWAINRALRQGSLDAPVQRMVKGLDALMRPESAETLHRVVDVSLMQHLKVGDTFTDEAYTSTLISPEGLSQFEEGGRFYQGGARQRAQIKVPGGYPRIDTTQYAPGPWAMAPAEGEVILPRGTTFKVISTTPLVLAVVPEARKHHRFKFNPYHDPATGRFSSGGGGHAVDIYGRTGMEGGGPERDKWEKLNDAVIEADDAEFDAREAHTDIALRLEKKYPADTPYTDYENADFEAYHTSREKALEAARAVEKAQVTLKAQEPAMKVEVVTNLATDVAKRLGVDPSIIDVVHKDPREFDVGDKHFTEAGHFNPGTGRVQVNAQVINYGDAQSVKGITAHELSHVMYHAVKQEGEKEFQRYLDQAVTPDGQDHSAWFTERFTVTPAGRAVKPEYREAMAKEFPAATAMAMLSGGDIFTGLSTKMKNENGHSAYAKSYWMPEAVRQKGSYESAINETMAEVTRYITYPASWNEPQTPHPQSGWVQSTVKMHEWYREYQDVAEARRLARSYAGIFKS